MPDAGCRVSDNERPSGGGEGGDLDGIGSLRGPRPEQNRVRTHSVSVLILVQPLGIRAPLLPSVPPTRAPPPAGQSPHHSAASSVHPPPLLPPPQSCDHCHSPSRVNGTRGTGLYTTRGEGGSRGGGMKRSAQETKIVGETTMNADFIVKKTI